MNAIVYTRSIPNSGATMESCETQDKICVEYAHKMGWPVAGVYDDPDRSGTDGCRPRLDAAMRALERGDVLLVYRWSCIARELILALQYEKQIEHKGAHVVAVTGGNPSGDPRAANALNVLAAVVKLEKRTASVRARTSTRTTTSKMGKADTARTTRKTTSKKSGRRTTSKTRRST